MGVGKCSSLALGGKSNMGCPLLCLKIAQLDGAWVVHDRVSVGCHVLPIPFWSSGDQHLSKLLYSGICTGGDPTSSSGTFYLSRDARKQGPLQDSTVMILWHTSYYRPLFAHLPPQ